MEKNSEDGAMIPDATTIEIKIITLDSRTYTLQVDRHVSVPALREQIATVSGVVAEQQRLLFRGRVLNDDQLLSAYHVENGDTLHLVVRQQRTPSSETRIFLGSHATDASSSTDNTQAGRVTVRFRRTTIFFFPNARSDTEEAEPEAANSGVGTSSTHVQAADSGDGTSSTDVQAADSGVGTSSTDVQAADSGVGTSSTDVQAADSGVGTSSTHVQAADSDVGSSSTQDDPPSPQNAEHEKSSGNE